MELLLWEEEGIPKRFALTWSRKVLTIEKESKKPGVSSFLWIKRTEVEFCFSVARLYRRILAAIIMIAYVLVSFFDCDAIALETSSANLL